MQPNRHGLGLALLLLVQFLIATHYNNNLGFILAFFIVAVALLAALHGFRNLAGLVVRPGRAEPVFAGELAAFECHIDNPSRHPRLALGVEAENATGFELDIPPSASAPAVIQIKAIRRGWLRLPALNLSSTFPLGIFRAHASLTLDMRALVYPPPAAPGLGFPGEGSDLLLAADDFVGFRNYQPGDPLRRIHWKGVAKGQGVYFKQYRGGEGRGELWLDWAQTPGRDAETRLGQLCRWALDAEQAGLCYGLRLPGANIAPARGANHLRRCLEALALFGL